MTLSFEPIILRHENGSIVLPGDQILPTLQAVEVAGQAASASAIGGDGTKQQQQQQSIQYIAGEGTYVRNEQIVASIVGRVHVSSTTVPIQMSESNAEQSQQPQLQMVTISVIPKGGCFRAKQQVIRVGQVVLGRVARIGMTQQQVTVDIVANPYGVLDYIAAGTIRRDDVTSIISKPLAATAGSSSTLNQSIPMLQLSQSFRVGDWIVAKVLSFGGDPNRGRYYLTTAESSLGVIYATCTTSRQSMIPISYKEMECPVTGFIETRKCARPPTNVM